MIRLFAILFIVLNFNKLDAQDLEQGPVYSGDRKFTVLRLNGFYKGDICVLKARTGKDELIKDIRIDLFDTSNLKHKSFAQWNDCFSDRTAFFPEGVLNFNDSLMLFGSEYNKGEQEMQLNVRGIFHQKEDVRIDSMHEVFSVKAAFGGFSGRRFRIAQEIQGKFLLMFYAGNPPDSDSLRLDFKVYDKNFKVVKEQHQVLPKMGVSFGLDEICVDESGNVFALLHWKSGGKKQQKSHYLYAFPSMLDEVVEYELALDDYSTEEVRMHLAANGKLWLAGLYFKNRKSDDAQPEGVYLLSFDLNGSELKQSTIRPFTQINYSGKDKQPQSLYGAGYLENLHLVELLESGDEMPLVVLEQQRREEICQTDFRSNMLVCNQHYFADALVVFQPQQNAQRDSCFVLDKKQHLVEDEQVYLSSIAIANPNGLPDFLCNANSTTSNGETPLLENAETGNSIKLRMDGSIQYYPSDLPLHITAGITESRNTVFLLGDGRAGNCIYRLRH
jgi:hypothetical protein